MGMPSPIAVSIELTEGEREQLESWSGRRTTAQALALRSRIVLAAAEGASSSQIASGWGCRCRRSASGATGSPRIGWMGWWMSRGRVGRGRSLTARWMR